MAFHSLRESFRLGGSFVGSRAPDRRIEGFIHSDSGRLEFEGNPIFRENMSPEEFVSDFNRSAQANPESPETFTGITEYGSTTLLFADRLQDGGFTRMFAHSLTYPHYRVKAAILGLSVPSHEDRCLDGCAIYLTKLHKMLPQNWETAFSEEQTTYVVPHKARQYFEIQSEQIRAALIFESFAAGGTKVRKSAEIVSIPRIRIVPQSPQSFVWVSELAERVENFFTLIMGTSVSIRGIQLFRGSDVGFVVQRLPRRKERANYQLWLKYPAEQIGMALQRWLEKPESERPVERTLLGMTRKTKLFVETEFLALAQSLEGFGRVQFSKLKIRRKQTLEAFLEEEYRMLSPDFALRLIGEKASFINEVGRTRDYFTHLGSRRNTRVTSGVRALFLLNQKLHSFLRCLLLLDLGIEESALVEPSIYSATRWR